jgi:hypothetical protein
MLMYYQKTTFLFLMLFCVHIPLQSTITEITSVAHLQLPSDAHTLVAFDLDNTVMEPESEIGSDQWFGAALEHLKNKGLSHEAAFKIVRPRYIHLQQRTPTKPVESAIVTYIKALQERHIPTLAITARSHPLQNMTIAQLKSIGISFNTHHYKNISMTLTNEKHPAHIKHGILFCGDNKKGNVLHTFLTLTKSTPKRVIMFDDKLHHLQEMEATFKKLGIDFHGYRYGHLDEKINKFRFDEQTLMG